MTVTHLATSEDRLRFSQEQSRAWIDCSPICTKIVDLDFNLQFMSAAGIESLGFDDVTEYYGKPYPFDFYPQDFCDEMSKNLKKARDTGEVVKQEGAVIDVEGNEKWFHSTIVPVCETGTVIDHFMVVSIDTTEQNKSRQALEQLNGELEVKVHRRTQELERVNKQLHHDSETDCLTDIPNRLAFDRRLNENVATAKRNNEYLSLLMIDVDHFKGYNDKFGHDVGDLVLKDVARVIDQSLPRKTDLVARFGGEEFVVLLPETDVNSAFSLAEKIRKNVFSLGGEDGPKGADGGVTVSVGVASLKGDALDAMGLLKCADKELYLAKQAGRNNCKLPSG